MPKQNNKKPIAELMNIEVKLNHVEFYNGKVKAGLIFDMFAELDNEDKHAILMEILRDNDDEDLLQDIAEHLRECDFKVEDMLNK